MARERGMAGQPRDGTPGPTGVRGDGRGGAGRGAGGTGMKQYGHRKVCKFRSE